MELQENRTDLKTRAAVLRRALSRPLLSFSLLCAACALIAFPKLVKDSVADSLLYCLTGLVPSLFPFMVLTAFSVNSGAGELLGRPLGPLVRYVFRLPEVCATPICLSFLGGYPAGAKAASLLLEQGKISREQAGRMMLFCVNPGVAFVVTFLGGGLLKSFFLGWLLFWSVTLAGLLLGILSGLGKPVPEKGTAGAGPASGGALIRSVSDASRSVVTMCACILLFSGLIALLHGTGLFQAACRTLSLGNLWTPMEAAALLSFLLEVTGGAGAAHTLEVGPVFYAFGLAFGGLCVHLQVFSFFERFPIGKGKFILFRFLHGAFAAGSYKLLTVLLPGKVLEAWTASGGVREVDAFSGTLAGGLSLLLMCMAFLLILSQGKEGQESIANHEKM